ncbi:6-hydroxynicotinate 3-monooxygenase [Mycena venus]|uniref:6-hydroxynicotinate 3-monooxygenase n=1 Tax=Mycena venus TaxID=2733690 RepID=A0A8H7CGF7_9AGAR|nr:6-hydroxynicotinate 3-monooxygenase [Mycena venus]
MSIESAQESLAYHALSPCGRIGHKVTVIEKKRAVTSPQHQRGVRMPPNLTKILFHWGLKDKLRAISVKSEAIHIVLDDTGELLGTQLWDEEILRETRGEYLFGHLSDLVTLLFEEAIRLGANFHFGTTTLSIDPVQGKVITDVRGILQADVIIGADGISGLTRRVLLGEQHAQSGNGTGSEPADRSSMWMYSAMFPKQVVLNDRELNALYRQEHTTLFVWLGNGRSAVGYPVGGTAEFAICAYGPYDAGSSPADGFKEKFKGTEPRFRNLLPHLAGSLRRQPVIESEPLEDWVSQKGRLVLVGTGAHPIPPGSIQESAMSVEDGAVLARLFSHLLIRAQINQFLWAFQDIRQRRCAAATESETHIMYYTCMPKGADQEARDAGLRAKKAAGVEVLQAGDDQEETPEWREVKEIFGYDAEDEADNWWVGWGSLKFKLESVESGGPGAIDLGGIQVKQTVN